MTFFRGGKFITSVQTTHAPRPNTRVVFFPGVAVLVSHTLPRAMVRAAYSLQLHVSRFTVSVLRGCIRCPNTPAAGYNWHRRCHNSVTSHVSVGWKRYVLPPCSTGNMCTDVNTNLPRKWDILQKKGNLIYKNTQP